MTSFSFAPSHPWRPNARMMLVSVVALLLSLVGQAAAPTTCAGAACPQPAATGTQPYPNDIKGFFDLAGTNRLGTSAPVLPSITKGYPTPTSIEPHVPCLLLKAVGAVETAQTRGRAEFDGWKQFNAAYGASGTTVIASDCGYGIMQITSGMDGSGGFSASRVAAEPKYNIGTAARILVEKWKSTPAVGTNNPYIMEHWYYAVWAYNSFSIENDPNNDRFMDSRPAWKCGRDANQNLDLWPYQEKVWGARTIRRSIL